MKKSLTLLLGMLLLYSCSSTSDNSNTSTPPLLPTLTTNTASTITTITATCGGEITSDGGAAIITRGIVWSTSTEPTIDLSTKTTNGSGKGSFSSIITGLNATTTYYVRAYATNSTGTSYGIAVSFTTAAPDIPPTTTIGTQTWTTKNLDVSTYSDGTTIPQVGAVEWANLTTGAWCYYENYSAGYATTYGKLYNWYAVVGIWDETSKTDLTQRKKLAPTGWHIPSDDEWTTLISYLGGREIAGGKMKETGTSHWTSINTDATNSSGFSGLPGGGRYNFSSFSGIGYSGNWWSSSERETAGAWYLTLNYHPGIVERDFNSKDLGFSVRCLKD